MQAEVKVTQASHMDELVNSDTRIILLYSTKVVIIVMMMMIILSTVTPGCHYDDDSDDGYDVDNDNGGARKH